MSFITKQKDGFKDVVMKMGDAGQCKIPNGECVTVLGEAGNDLYHVEWHGHTGTIRKDNLVPAKPETVITQNPSNKFNEVFLWRHGAKTSVPNGTSLDVVRSEINSHGFFYVVVYNDEEFSVKQDNVQIGVLSHGPEKENGYKREEEGHRREEERTEFKVKQPSTLGDIFAATQVTKMNEELLKQIKGDRLIKASMPPFNRKGGGNLPDASEVVDAPAFGVRVSDAIMEIMSIDGMSRLSAALQVGVPSFQLNHVVQARIREAIRSFKRDVQDLLTEDWVSGNAEAFAKLEEFASEVEQLKPDSSSVVSMKAWIDFVGKFVAEGWQTRLHVNEVLLNFGFVDEAIHELFAKLATMTSEADSKVKSRIMKHLAWFSKALGCYGLVGSLSDVVNLAFAMTGVPTPPPRHISEDEVVTVLMKLKNELTKLSSGSSVLWIPSIYIQDCEMDDMLAWLILAYAHHKRGSKLEVYAQLPWGKPEQKSFLDVYERRLSHHCTQVYRDRGAINYDSISVYFAAKISPDYFSEKAAVAPSAVAPAYDVAILDYQGEITETFVSERFLADPDVPSTLRIEMITYEKSHTLLHTVSSFCSLLEERLASPPFAPPEHKAGSFPDDNASKKLLRNKLDSLNVNVTSKFALKGTTLNHGRIVLAWHGCKSSIVESIRKTGFAAFGDLDAGYFGHGIYVALESTYAVQYAQGMYDPDSKKYPNSDGECAVLLVACLVGHTYPITPCESDFKKVGSLEPRKCKWYGTPLKSRYHSHLTAIHTKKNCTCVKPDEAEHKPNQFHELVLKESAQLLPLAVVWFKS